MNQSWYRTEDHMDFALFVADMSQIWIYYRRSSTSASKETSSLILVTSAVLQQEKVFMHIVPYSRNTVHSKFRVYSSNNSEERVAWARVYRITANYRMRSLPHNSNTPKPQRFGNACLFPLMLALGPGMRALESSLHYSIISGSCVVFRRFWAKTC